MKRVGLFAALIIATSLVLFPSCDNGSTDGSADIEGIWVAAGQDEGIGKAMLFEFSGNEFTRIAYTELTVGEDAPDMFQDEGAKGTYSVSDDILTVTETYVWPDPDGGAPVWSPADETRSAQIDLQGNTLKMNLPDMGWVDFDKKSFSRPSALVGTWDEIDGSGATTGRTLVGNADGTYVYTDSGEDYEATGTWSASPDLLRFITTYENDGGIESTFYIENLYEYEITGSNLKTSWNATGTEFSEYTQAD